MTFEKMIIFNFHKFESTSYDHSKRGEPFLRDGGKDSRFEVITAISVGNPGLKLQKFHCYWEAGHREAYFIFPCVLTAFGVLQYFN